MSYTLDDCEARAKQYPGRFNIPPIMERRQLKKGHIVKLIFNYSDGSGERMWVVITDVQYDGALPFYSGRLDSVPIGSTTLRYGDSVPFRPHHVADIYPIKVT